MSNIEKRSVNGPNGKKETVVYAKNKHGKWVRLLNPAQKGRKYAKDLKLGRDSVTGKPLRDTQKAHRSGYLKARADNAKAWKARRAKRANSRKKNS